jgi:hypothetical protein
VKWSDYWTDYVIDSPTRPPQSRTRHTTILTTLLTLVLRVLAGKSSCDIHVKVQTPATSGHLNACQSCFVMMSGKYRLVCTAVSKTETKGSESNLQLLEVTRTSTSSEVEYSQRDIYLKM